MRDGSTAVPLTGLMALEEPKTFAFLFSGGVAASTAGAHVGTRVSTGAGPASAGSELLQSEHALFRIRISLL